MNDAIEMRCTCPRRWVYLVVSVCSGFLSFFGYVMLDFLSSFTTQKLNHKLGRNMLGLFLKSQIRGLCFLVEIKIDGKGKSMKVPATRV